MDHQTATLVTLFTAAIVALWTKLAAEHKALAARCDACELDRINMWKQLTECAESLTLLSSCPTPHCGAKIAAAALAAFKNPTTMPSNTTTESQ